MPIISVAGNRGDNTAPSAWSNKKQEQKQDQCLEWHCRSRCLRRNDNTVAQLSSLQHVVIVTLASQASLHCVAVVVIRLSSFPLTGQGGQ